MTDADLILALRQRGWTDCADAIEAGQQLEPKHERTMTPEQIAEAGQRLAELRDEYAARADMKTAHDCAIAILALREWVPREDREMMGTTEERLSPATAVDALDQWTRLHRTVGEDYYGAWMKLGGILRELAASVEEDDEGHRRLLKLEDTPDA